MSFWSGLTDTGNGKSYSGGGTGPGAGIYQSGFDATEYCAGIFLIVCLATYSGWYEFYPNAPNYCLSGITSGNNLNSGTYPYTAGHDFSAIDDWQEGSLCWGVTATGGSMGPVQYAQFQAESDLNPVNDPYQTPNFNFQYNPVYVGGSPADLVSLVQGQNHVSGVTLYQMQYNSGAGASHYQIT
jgi:hypothetical protein